MIHFHLATNRDGTSRRIGIHRLWLCCVLAATGAGASDSPQAAEPVSADEAQVRQWVRDLGSDRFVDREVATGKLVAAGAVAVGPIVDGLSSNDLEITTRGIYILQELALSLDPDIEEPARTALERIAQPRGTSAARRAAEALVKLDDVRQERAISTLKRLGAVIGNQPSQLGLPLAEQLTIEIGEAWHGTAQDLGCLRWVQDVGELILSGPQITDSCLQSVGRMKGLGSLTLRRAAVTDRGLASLNQVQGLSTLSVLYVPISDAAVPDLTRLKTLASLRLYGTQLSDAGTERLKGVFGETADIRRGAFLGVGCDPGQEGCVVYIVRPNTPAEKAGVMVNDVLLEYEGQRLPDYKSLTTLVGRDEPGKTISLKILRGTETMVKQIKLGEW